MQQQYFYADTPDAALKMAQECADKMDYMRQPMVYGPYPTQPSLCTPKDAKPFYARIDYWGLD